MNSHVNYSPLQFVPSLHIPRTLHNLNCLKWPSIEWRSFEVSLQRFSPLTTYFLFGPPSKQFSTGPVFSSFLYWAGTAVVCSGLVVAGTLVFNWPSTVICYCIRTVPLQYLKTFLPVIQCCFLTFQILKLWMQIPYLFFQVIIQSLKFSFAVLGRKNNCCSDINCYQK